MWLTGRLAPDFKTIADFRKDHGDAIRKVCREFVVLYRRLKPFTDGIVAIDGSTFKAVNSRDKNFTDRKLQARMDQLEDCIKRYLVEIDRADRDATAVLPSRDEHLKESTPEEVAGWVQRDTEKWGRIIREAAITID